LVVYPTLPGKPVQSQDTLGRKLLKVCAGSKPHLDRRSVVLSFSCQILCPHETGQILLCKANTFERPAYRMEPLPSLAVPQVCRRQLFGRHLVDDGFTPSLSQAPAQMLFGMILILPASDSTRFVRLSQVAQVRKKRGALHKTIIAKHLQGKIRAICESEEKKDGS
jgi:hypothetical protein